MSPSGPIRVTGKDGWQGTIEASSRAALGSESEVTVLLDDGRELRVAGTDLEPQSDGSYSLPMTLAATEEQPAAPMQAGNAGQDGKETLVVPVVEEQLKVDRRQVVSGRVRVHKTVTEEPTVVDEPLWHEAVDVERVAINRVVDGPVPVRYEGDTMIVPIIAEELVVEKRLVLKEELRITRRRTQVREVRHVTLRKEEATVERLDESQPGSSAAQ